jgi:NAD-dependent dihydropyrimidine dehydrogenase PreA subunit
MPPINASDHLRVCIAYPPCYNFGTRELWPAFRFATVDPQHITRGNAAMTYIITEPCVGVKDAACVDVCPVDCIYTTDDDDMYFISPDECIDCAACEPVCPVTAIFAEEAVPSMYEEYIKINYDYFSK